MPTFIVSGTTGDVPNFRAKRPDTDYHLSAHSWVSSGPIDNVMTWDADLSGYVYTITGSAPSADFNYMVSASGGIVKHGSFNGNAETSAIISGLGAWGDLRWSKIYGIPLDEWDIIVSPYTS